MAQKKQVAKPSDQTRDGDGRFTEKAAAEKPSGSSEKAQSSKGKPASSKRK
jgi:hypothetical protein